MANETCSPGIPPDSPCHSPTTPTAHGNGGSVWLGPLAVFVPGCLAWDCGERRLVLKEDEPVAEDRAERESIEATRMHIDFLIAATLWISMCYGRKRCISSGSRQRGNKFALSARY